MAEETRVHVVMIPWSAFGHLIPFFNLSIALAKAGIHVSYISTPRNIQRLPQLPSTLTHLIHLVPIPLPQLDNNNNNLLLPQGAESTMDIPAFDKFQYLKLAYDKLQHPIRNLVSNWLPNWIICDFSPHWVVDIAHEFHVKLIYYSVFSSPALSLVGLPQKVTPESTRSLLSPERLMVKPKWVTFPSTVAFKRHEAVAIVSEASNVNASGVSDRERFDKIIRASEVVLCRGCYEIDGEYINLYEKLIGKPVIPIGLLPIEKPMKGKISNGLSCDDDDKKIFDWLDKQETKSVVFVAFGSECKLNKEQIYEIAFGLEMSNLPFLWAIRKPSWAIKQKTVQCTKLSSCRVSGGNNNNENDHGDGGDDDSLVPIGFIERTSGRGIVCNGWIPQQEILAHPSIGGSLFHSGWGSVIESLQFGHNLVVLPFIFDQPLNARFLVDKGLATEVERQEDGSFTRHDIAKSLRQAMVLEEGKNTELSVKTREAAAIVGDLKLHRDRYLATFVQFLKDGIWKKKN